MRPIAHRVRPDRPLGERGSETPDASEGSRLPASVRALSVERRLRRGEVLFRKDDTAIGLYAVEGGHIRLSRVDSNGREIVQHTAGPGDVVAEASLFSPRYLQKPRIFRTVCALTATTSDPALAPN